MKEINNDYSVFIYDYYNDYNYYYIVMEKCDGDLYDLLNEKKSFSESEIKKILLQLNTALKIMFEKKIVHRDLKPENIFIKYLSPNKNEFIVKLGDFGNSRKYQQNNHSTKIVTEGYAAPEIYFFKNYDPTKCDLWSIGVIIYKLKFNEIPGAFILGEIPGKFDDENLYDLLKKLIVVKPDERISWKDYFEHPFFK